MGTVKDVKGSKGFCDEVYAELSGMKKKILDLQSRSGGSDNEIAKLFERHLCELAEEIDWKLQILAHSCPYDWKGSDGFEDAVQVTSVDTQEAAAEFSPGYLGG